MKINSRSRTDAMQMMEEKVSQMIWHMVTEERKTKWSQKILISVTEYRVIVVVFIAAYIFWLLLLVHTYRLKVLVWKCVFVFSPSSTTSFSAYTAFTFTTYNFITLHEQAENEMKYQGKKWREEEASHRRLGREWKRKHRRKIICATSCLPVSPHSEWRIFFFGFQWCIHIEQCLVWSCTNYRHW